MLIKLGTSLAVPVEHIDCKVVKHLAMEKGKDHPWHRCLDKTKGRRHFQMDLGNDLVMVGTSMDWKDPTVNQQ